MPFPSPSFLPLPRPFLSFPSRSFRSPTPRPSQSPLRRKSFPRASLGWQGWQESILGNIDAYPSFSTISSSFPSSYGEIYLLALSFDNRFIYLTFQASCKTRAIRATYATSSQAFPVHLKGGVQRAIVTDVLRLVNEKRRVGDTGGKIRLLKWLFGTGVGRLLGMSDLEVVDLARKVISEEGPQGNLREIGKRVLKEVGVQIVGGSVEEVEHLGGESLVEVGGFLFVDRGLGVERMKCAVVEAVSVANLLGVECFMKRDLFEGGGVTIEDMVEVFEGGGDVKVREKEGEGRAWNLNHVEEERGRRTRGMKPEELKADQVLAMKEPELRAILTAAGVPSRTGEGKSSLLSKLIPLMDEVERRELGIQLAAENQLYAVAAELQKGRSKRGRLLLELKEAEREERWGQVVRLGKEIREMEKQIADRTAEPGSYNTYLDQDDWYRPNR